MNNNLSGGVDGHAESPDCIQFGSENQASPAQPSRTPTKGGDASCREIGEIQMEQSLASNAAPTVQSAGRSATFQGFLDSLKPEYRKGKKITWDSNYASRR